MGLWGVSVGGGGGLVEHIEHWVTVSGVMGCKMGGGGLVEQ